MKKRLLCMLMALIMVASLFSGMSLSAFAADGDTIEYTMQDGDNVWNICRSYGLNYNTCKPAIMALNGFTSEASFGSIPVGKVIKLPASNLVAQSIATNGTTVTTTNTTTTQISANGNTVAYWLIPYTMQRGETVYSVCNALGISYNTYADQIQKLNGLQSTAWVKAGQTLLMPSPTKPAVGVSCYEVQAHKVTAGETVFSICNSTGVSYTGNVKLLQGMNNSNNLNYIAAGSTFYVPVATVISAATTVNGGTSTTAAPTTTATNGTTTTTATKYALTANSTTGGLVGFYVGGKAVTEAAAGDIVTVVPMPNGGQAVDKIKIIFSDGSATPVLSGGDTFVMPSCAVSANVSFKTGYSITIDSTSVGSVKVLVDGVVGGSASKGSTVQIVSADPSLAVDGKILLFRDDGTAATDVKISDDYSFIMPNYNLTVRVKLKTVETYDFYKEVGKNVTTVASGGASSTSFVETPEAGSFVLQVNGNTVSSAAAGSKVTVLVSRTVGYTLDSVEYRPHGTGDFLPTTANSFIMPDQDVDVRVTLSPEAGSIKVNASTNGKIYAVKLTDNGTSATPRYTDPKKLSVAATGTTVYILARADSGYTCEPPVVRSTLDGTRVNVTDEGKTISYSPSLLSISATYNIYSFTMPGGGATVSGQFIGEDKTITVENYLTVGKVSTISTDVGNVLIDGSITASTPKKAGTNVDVIANPNVGYEFKRFEVLVNGKVNKDLTASANDEASIIMPENNITIRAYFEQRIIKVSDLDLPYCSISFVNKADPTKGVTSYKMGEEAMIIVRDKPGYTVKKEHITVVNAVTGEEIKLTDYAYPNNINAGKAYTFAIPFEGVKITVDVNLSSQIIRPDPANVGQCIVNILGNSEVLNTAGIRVAVGLAVTVSASDSLRESGRSIKSVTAEYTPVGGAATKSLAATLVGDGLFRFIMPDAQGDVTLKLETTETVLSVYNITANGNGYCFINFFDSNNAFEYAQSYKAGDTVLMKLTPADSIYTIEDSNIEVKETSTNTIIPVSRHPELKGYYTFTMPAGAVTVTVNATRRSVMLEAGGMAAGNVQVNCNGASAYIMPADSALAIYVGSKVTVTNIVSGRTIESVTLTWDNNVKALTPSYENGPYTFDMPDATSGKVILNVSYAKPANAYTLTPAFTCTTQNCATYTGTVTFYDKAGKAVNFASKNDAITAVVTPAVGHAISGTPTITGNGTVTRSGDNTYSFTMTDSNLTFTVPCAEIVTNPDYTLNKLAVTNGTVEIDGGLTAAKAGDVITVTYTPSPNFTTDSKTVIRTDDSTPVAIRDDDGLSFKFTMPASNVNIDVKFVKAFHRLTSTSTITGAEIKFYDAGNNPIASGSLVEAGSTVTVKAVAVAGYELKSGTTLTATKGGTNFDLTADAADLSVKTFTMDNADMTLDFTATFEKKTLTITAAGASADATTSQYNIKVGSAAAADISSTSKTVSAKVEDAIKVSPKAGFSLGSVTVKYDNGTTENVTILGDGTADFTMKGYNCTITVVLNAIP